MNDPKIMRVHYGSNGASIDLMNPKVEDICMESVWERLGEIKRFGGRPDAWEVDRHLDVVCHLAYDSGEAEDVTDWAMYHDYHEAFTGDIIAPMKQLINHTAGKDVFAEIEPQMDRLICEAAGIEYPSAETRARVHHYDMMARRIEMEELGMTPDPSLPQVGEPYQPGIVGVAV